MEGQTKQTLNVPMPFQDGGCIKTSLGDKQQNFTVLHRRNVYISVLHSVIVYFRKALYLLGREFRKL